MNRFSSVRLPVKGFGGFIRTSLIEAVWGAGFAIVSVNLQLLKESIKFWYSESKFSGFRFGLGSNGLKPSTIKEVARGSVSTGSSLVYVLSKSSSLQLRGFHSLLSVSGFVVRVRGFVFSQAKKLRDVSR